MTDGTRPLTYQGLRRLETTIFGYAYGIDLWRITYIEWYKWGITRIAKPPLAALNANESASIAFMMRHSPHTAESHCKKMEDDVRARRQDTERLVLARFRRDLPQAPQDLAADESDAGESVDNGDAEVASARSDSKSSGMALGDPPPAIRRGALTSRRWYLSRQSTRSLRWTSSFGRMPARTR